MTDSHNEIVKVDRVGIIKSSDTQLLEKLDVNRVKHNRRV